MKRDLVEDIYRLSPVQEGMLFHALRAEVPGTYLQQFAYALDGEFDAAAFARAFKETVDRHPALRTAFLWERAGRPLQVVLRRAELPVETERWPPMAEESARRSLADLLRRDRERGLDLGQPPLSRLTLVEIETGTGRSLPRYLLWTYHHLVLDGWSMALVLGEVMARYRGLVGGPPFDRQPPRSFRDYVSWLERQDLAAAEVYWRQALLGLDGITPLPSGDVLGTGGGKRTLVLPAAVRMTLETRAQHSGLTLNTLAQGAWALSLARASDLREVVFGTVVSGRPADLEGVEAMVGMFINTLPTRIRIPSRLPVGEWLRDLQQGQLEMRRFEHTPLSQIQGWSGMPAGKPMFESILVFENRALFASAASGNAAERSGALRLRSVEFRGETGYPVVAAIEPREGLALTLAYDRGRFDPVTIERWLEHLAVLFESLAGDPGRPVESLSPLSPGAVQQILVEWNDRRRASSAECLHRRFSAQAARTPDAIALECGGEEITYRELDRQADRLAGRLRGAGVGPEVRVGILLRRSIQRIVAVLGVLKAGGAYLPLDPDQPAARLTGILADAGAPLLLTGGGLGEGITTPGLRKLQLNAMAGELAGWSADEPRTAVEPGHLAYVIYTSGSTGRPRGVMVPHREIDATLGMRQATHPLGPGDRVLDTTSFGFDATLWSTFGPLYAGARLVLSLPEGETDRLGEVVARHRITAMQLPPAWLRLFLEQHPPGAGSALRYVISGGEALSHELQESFFARLDGGLFHFYGPTEAALDTTSWSCRRDERRRTLPIGRPIGNKEVYLLDCGLRPVPLGTAGELCIAGEGLARGYLSDPALTALRFVPQPWSSRPGVRLYRSGDLARFLLDGNLEFLGRIDHQVKVRGYRIELGEIEAALGRHSDVRLAVVAAREEAPGGAKRLVGYVVPHPGRGPSAGELRRFLQAELPDYMVPATFVELGEVPLSASGKVDRSRLPAPGAFQAAAASRFVAPRNARETALAAIWGAVLGVDRVGIHDNFFELGGDSILSLQISARARQAGFALTTRQLFEHQTLAELSTLAPAGEPALLEPGSTAGEVALTPIQRWFFDSVRTDLHHWNQTMLLAASRPLAPGLLERAVHVLLAHHDALRLRFISADGDWRQIDAGAAGESAGEAPGGAHFVHLDLAGLPEDRRISALEVAAAAFQASLDLERGPLLRAALLTPGGDEPDRLLLVVHHLVVDGVSWRLLLEDLTAVYEQLARGEAAALPPKTSSFQRWAERLREHAQTPAVAAELDSWLELGRAGAALPRDRPGGRNTEALRRTLRVELAAAETRTLLRELPRAFGTRIEDVLLTSVALAFRTWTGEPGLLLDVEGHGREELFADVDLSRTVGWFTSEYPVLLEVAEPAGPAGDLAALRAVKERLRRIPGRGIGYGLLRYLHADPAVRERLRALPQAEVLFNYLGQFDGGRAASSPWGRARESAGPPRGPRGERFYLFELNGSVSGGRLLFDWSYGSELHSAETVERLAGEFLSRLRRLVAHCAAPGAGGLVTADFPLAGIDPATLDRLMAAGGPPIEDLYPLSPMQQGMLFESLHDDRGAYVMQIASLIRGDLDVAAFAAAWRQVIERHPVLRTGFVWEGCDQPLQIIRRDVPTALAEEDWRGLGEEAQERRLEELGAERRRGFDLTRAPLIRLDLLRLDERSWRFLWSSHHLVLDGWSTPMLYAEFLALYREQQSGVRAELPERRPYRDYIAWLGGQDPAAAERYFLRSLAGYAGAPPLEPLLAPEVRRPGESYAEVRMLLPRERTVELQAFVRRHHLTLSVLVQGAWTLLLSRLGGSPDVVFGVTVSGRPAALAGVEGMIGMFINTLPVRLQVISEGPGSDLLTWLREHQERQAELGEYDYTSLAKIQQWCRLRPGSALFQSILVFENYPEPAGAPGDASGGLDFGGFRYFIRESFPLILDVGPGAELSLRLKYDEGLYRKAALGDALGDLGVLLESFLEQPEASLASFLGLLDSRAGARQEIHLRELRETRQGRLQQAARRGAVRVAVPEVAGRKEG